MSKISIKNFFLFVFSLLIFLFLAEFVLRILMHGKYANYDVNIKGAPYIINGKETLFIDRYVKDDVFAFKLKPNYKEEHIDKIHNLNFSFSTNSEGFRQADDTKKLISNKSRTIMVLGDSLTFGHGVDQEFSYPEILQLVCDNSTAVLNFGVGAWSFAEYYLTFRKYSQALKPSLVVIGVFPANDFRELDNTYWKGKRQGFFPVCITRSDFYIDRNGHLRNQGLKYKIHFLMNSYLWNSLAEKTSGINKRIQVKLFSNDSVNIGASLITQISKESSVLVLLLPAEYTLAKTENNDVRRFKELLQNTANVKILDFYPILSKAGDYKKFYIDGSHFTRDGNYFIAKKIFEFIKDNNLIHGIDNANK